MPPTKKAAGTAVDPRNGRRAEVVAPSANRLPAPKGLSEEAESVWGDYWEDAVSGVATKVDRVVLHRWITNIDRYYKLVAQADLEPVVIGYAKQQVENPLYQSAYKALAVAEKCEAQLGIGALNRSKLGIAVLNERRGLAEINAAYGNGPQVGGGDGSAATTSATARPDPRLRVIQGGQSGAAATTHDHRADPRIIDGTATG